MQVEPSTRFANRALDSGERFLRRAKKRSPLSASECLQMPKYQRFPPFSDVRISSKTACFTLFVLAEC